MGHPCVFLDHMVRGRLGPEVIGQEHRVAAAAKLRGMDAKIEQVRERILAGLADDHPAVQAAAFYGGR